MKKHSLRVMSALLFSALFSVLVGAAVAGESKSFPLAPAYQEECGSCHLAFPPALLPVASWRAVMAGLTRHFGSDASLDQAKAREIGNYLDANAARREQYATRDAGGRPLLRITEGDWFRREHRSGHDGITAAVWQLPSVKSAANCAACHRGAAQGDYSEREIRIPRS